jgi:hypothetical protein
MSDRTENAGEKGAQVFALRSKRAESGLGGVYPKTDKRRAKPWRVEVWRGVAQHVATVHTLAEGATLAAVANQLRVYAQQLARREFRQTAKRLADDHASGQRQLPLGDPFEALPLAPDQASE